MTVKTTTHAQQGDVLLFSTPDGGEIEIVNGVATMSAGLQVSVYLSLFGGNEQDDGVAVGNTLQYWGNFIEPDPVHHLRGRVQYLLRSLPATANNLRRVEEAAKKDLAWLLTEKVASSLTVSASVPAINTICLKVGVSAYGEESEFKFTENWKAST